MSIANQTLAQLVQGKEKYLLYPAAIISSIAGLLVILPVFFGAADAPQRFRLIIAGAGVIGYAWMLSLALVVPVGRKPYIRWIIPVLNAVGMVALFFLLPINFRPFLYMLWIATVTLSCIIIGRWQVYLMICVFNALAFIVIRSLNLTWEDIFIVSLTGITINETLYRLGWVLSKKVQRLEAINRMSRNIASSIDVDKVISLVCASVQDALLADTYYFGLVNDGIIRLELFYDDGEFFPEVEIPVENTLAGRVIENGRALLVRDMPEELPLAGISSQIIGKPRPSLSWMGAPVAVGKRIHGIVAMASYRRNAFDQDDLELLESMAQQTALVIDNAYRYAEVERLSRVDSLTQVYNHGQFLAYLEEYVQQTRMSKSPLSLIMADVDHFKLYNDNYGHLSGDQALIVLVTALRQSVRSKDLLGRWGGEEFAILLPETSGVQAMQVADRIRQNLRALTITTQDGRSIPMPTVSQGIAVFAEASSGEKLVDLADQRLYLAKGRGRDQIEPQAAYWTQEDPVNTSASSVS